MKHYLIGVWWRLASSLILIGLMILAGGLVGFAYAGFKAITDAFGI